MKEVKNITVLGAGAMGAQIAALAVEAGYNVTVRDIEQKFLDKGRQLMTDAWDKRIKRGEITAEKKAELLGKADGLQAECDKNNQKIYDSQKPGR